jgi:hypothetical protein
MCVTPWIHAAGMYLDTHLAKGLGIAVAEGHPSRCAAGPRQRSRQWRLGRADISTNPLDTIAGPSFSIEPSNPARREGSGFGLATDCGDSAAAFETEAAFSFSEPPPSVVRFLCMQKRTRRRYSTRQNTRPWGVEQESWRSCGETSPTRERRSSIAFWHAASLRGNNR